LTASQGALTNLSAVACTPSGKSTSAAIAKWTYEHIDVLAGPVYNSVPLSVARDPGGYVWMNEEFHSHLKRVNDPGMLTLPLPQNATGLYAWMHAGIDTGPTQMSVLGEDIMVDPQGRVWMTEGGSAPYGGTKPNHARIIMYDPAVGVIRTLNIPGDRNGVFGLAWDSLRNRIWFTESRRSLRPQGSFSEVIAQRARVTSFDPTCIGNYLCPNPPNYNFPNWQTTFSYDTDATSWTCVGGSTSPTAPTVGTCQNSSGNNGRKCFTSQDCVLSNLRCRP